MIINAPNKEVFYLRNQKINFVKLDWSHMEGTEKLDLNLTKTTAEYWAIFLIFLLCIFFPFHVNLNRNLLSRLL